MSYARISVIAFAASLVVLVIMRVWLLPKTLYFWGDIGRDHEMLMEMTQDARPVLLGPSNSQLPFNQSAWYFYLNLPVFWLTGFSAYTTMITGLVLTIASFLVATWILTESGKRSHALWGVSAWTLLMAMEPFLVEQQRSTWNPAFAVPFLVVATSILWQWLRGKSVSWKYCGVFAFSLAFGVGMTYALVPMALVYGLAALWILPKKQRWHLVAWTLGALGLVFLPHLIFEARHGFLLTQQLLRAGSPGAPAPLWQKFQNATYFLLGFKFFTEQATLSLIAALSLFAMGFVKTPLKTRRPFIILTFLGVFAFFISVLAVSQFNSHYSLGLSVLALFLVSRLRLRWQVLITLLLIPAWIPFVREEYTQKPHRTVADLEQCAELVCANYKEPMYVAAQAWHDFHSGFDYSFFFNKHGCRTRDIGSHAGYSQTMALVVDKSSFDEKTTDFFELSQFGAKKQKQVISCKADLSVYILEKI